jgi:hypothetical protein
MPIQRRPERARPASLSPGRLPGLLLRGLLLLVFLSVPAYLVMLHFAAFEPYLYPLHRLQGGAVQATRGVLVGAYPDYVRLGQLQRSGYRTVVSLLSPDILYERSLIERERGYARALGLGFRNYPMRSEEPPDSPGNAAALAAIGRLLDASPATPVYIHCYLGKHRSRMVVRWLAQRHGPGR